MPAKLEIDDQLSFKYTLLDIREFTTDELLASSQIEANLLAILTRLQNQRAVIQTVLRKITHLDDAAWRDALARLLTISGLRQLGHVIKEEVTKMPILNDLSTMIFLGRSSCRAARKGVRW